MYLVLDVCGVVFVSGGCMRLLLYEESSLFIPELSEKFTFCPITFFWSETNPELLEKSISHLTREKMFVWTTCSTKNGKPG